MITLQAVLKIFDPDPGPAVDHITATFEEGQIAGLVGPDGAGKTTLIRLMDGLLLPTQGKIRVGGLDTVTQAEEIHKICSYMPQKFGLYEDLTVLQNLNLYADLRGVVGTIRQETYERLLDFTSLKPFVDRVAGKLSGGMKQKLGLACALIQKPKVLLLDEPSVGVDPVSRRELWEMVHQLVKEGVTVVWSTAYLDEAARCDKVILLNEGKMLFHGPPQELTARVEGRTFKIVQIEGRKRLVLSRALAEPGVIDGVIQGTDLRIVTKTKGESLNLKALQAGPQVTQLPTPPRFEDAFIDILGGGPGGFSKLAEMALPIPLRNEAIVEARSLTKKFGNFVAADHITFSIKSGEIFGLLGPNGAGKSTTFKMMCGLLKPTSGDSFVNGLNLQTASGKARQQIGYMAQKFSLYGDLSVRQNLMFFSGIYGLKGPQRDQMVGQMIETFGLQSYLDISASLLPLGFKQRLALACAMMHEPSVLFLDEPTSGVDPITRREFWNHINGLVEKGVTVMVTTHFMDEAEYCDRIALIYRSQMIEMGTPDELKEKAKSLKYPNPTLEDAFIELIERNQT